MRPQLKAMPRPTITRLGKIQPINFQFEFLSLFKQFLTPNIRHFFSAILLGWAYRSFRVHDPIFSGPP